MRPARRRGPAPRAASPPRGRRWWLAAGACLLCLTAFAWHIVAAALSDGLAQSDPDAALWWDPGHGDALLRAAEARRAAAQGALDPALALVRRALRTEPVLPAALSLYGRLLDGSGRGEAARQVMALAADRSPRDVVAQLWRYDRGLREGRIAEGIAALDPVFRVYPSMLTGVMNGPGALPPLDNAAVRTALAEVLRSAPPWRKDFLDGVVREWRSPEGAIALFALLQEQGADLRPDELGPFLTRLVAEGRADQAYLFWTQTLTPEQLSDASYLFNGRFEYDRPDLPFDWSLRGLPGLEAALVREGDRRVFSLTFPGARVSLRRTAHLLLLPPGAYRFRGEVRTEALRGEVSPRWRLACQSAPDGDLGATGRLAETTDWRAFAVDFTVPPSGCPVQILVLELPARVALEQQISGVLLYAGLGIDRR